MFLVLDSRPAGLNRTWKTTRVGFSCNLAAKLLLVCLLAVPTNASCKDRLFGQGCYHTVTRLGFLLIVLATVSCFTWYFVVIQDLHPLTSITSKDLVESNLKYLTKTAFDALTGTLNGLATASTVLTGFGVAYSIFLCVYLRKAAAGPSATIHDGSAVALLMFSVLGVIIASTLFVNGGQLVSEGMSQPGYLLQHVLKSTTNAVHSAPWALVPVLPGLLAMKKANDYWKKEDQETADSGGQSDSPDEAALLHERGSVPVHDPNAINALQRRRGSRDGGSCWSRWCGTRRRLSPDNFRPFLRTVLELNQAQA